jgi:hypothetical protein
VTVAGQDVRWTKVGPGHITSGVEDYSQSLALPTTLMAGGVFRAAGSVYMT